PTPMTPSAPYPNSTLPSARSSNPNSPGIGGGSGMNQPDLNTNAQQRQELRQDRQELRQDRQNDRLDRMNERQTVRNEDPRFRLLNNEWWYGMPGNYWMYYRDNNWNRYDGDTFQPDRYNTGYRGDMGNNPRTYYDENGRQYRRDYSPLRRALRRAGEA